MTPWLPDRTQARKLVVSLGVFWGSFLVSMPGFGRRPAGDIDAAPTQVSMLAFFIGFAAVAYFYYTLYTVWQRETGISPRQFMFSMRMSPQKRRAQWHMFDLVRPTWIRHTLRETGWNPWVVGVALLILLVADFLVLGQSMAAGL